LGYDTYIIHGSVIMKLPVYYLKQAKKVNRKAKEVLSGSWYQRNGREQRKRSKRVNGESSVYTCMKMEKRYLLKLFQEWEEGG
jgi:hypothetical protein